jgi:hypothetical protein
MNLFYFSIRLNCLFNRLKARHLMVEPSIGITSSSGLRALWESAESSWESMSALFWSWAWASLAAISSSSWVLNSGGSSWERACVGTGLRALSCSIAA